MKVFYFILIIVAVSAIAIADIFLKKAATLGSFNEIIKSPWFIAALLFYLIQIIIFTYVFVSGATLNYVGIVQTVLYALIVVFAGIFLFSEHLTGLQITGAVIAIFGAVLLSL